MSDEAQAATDTAQEAESEETQETEPEAQAADGESSEDGKPEQPGSVDELPEWAQGVISDLRSENAKHRQAKKEAEAQAAKAEEERLAKQEEWQELAQKRQERIGELEPQAELAAQYEEMVIAQVESEIEDWPDEAKALIPDDADTMAMIAAVKRARPLVAKLADAGPAPGNGPGPKPAGAAGQRKADDAARKEFGRTVRMIKP